MNQALRMVLAILLSAFVYFGYFIYVAPKFTPPPMQQQTASNEVQSVTSNTPADAPTVVTVAPASSPTAQIEARKISFKTDLTEGILNTQGGVLESLILHKFQVEPKPDAKLIDLLSREGGSSQALFMGLEGYASLNEKTVFELVDDKEVDGVRQIVMAWQDEKIRLEKTFSIKSSEAGPYQIELSYQVKNVSSQTLSLQPFVTFELMQAPDKNGGFFSFLQAHSDYENGLYDVGNKIKHTDWHEIKKNGTVTPVAEGMSWSGLADRYFLKAAAPVGELPSTVSFSHLASGKVRNKLTLVRHDLLPGASQTGKMIAYLGPKQASTLTLAGVGFEHAIDYGMFSFIAKPILWFMGVLRQFISNWGLVIITLTFCIKILLHPINKKAMTSMKEMQHLQPKMEEIRKRFPDDKERQQRETMMLFKTHRINPFGGCMLMGLQVPVYIALYQVLNNAVELYHAPFFGFYKDLAAPDPHYIMPVLLGVFMFLQQKLTPSPSTDPMQKKMMMFMNLFFIVLWVVLPVGLILYILVNTFMSVVQQFMIHRELTIFDLLKGNFKAKPV